uniref:Reverse transcriptase zinc-binding domain-containing protein n=1 Tax=Cannabis sativa TaxID=3483 RepID=A0A803NTK6_CANSA
MCRNFLWGEKDNRSRLHMASWNLVCLPRELGGLGFREGPKWNKAALAKYLWAITTKKDVLWVKWVNNLYIKDQEMWSLELKADVSWYWRKILRLRDSFTREAIMKAGTNVNFSIRQAYDYLISKETSFDSKKAVWCKLSRPKHRFIMWQMVHSNLLTRDNLVKKHVSIDSAYCPVCEWDLESHEHLFFECPFSWRVMQNIKKWLGDWLWPNSFQLLLEWIQGKRPRSLLMEIYYATLASAIYGIWINWNLCVFEGKCIAPLYIDRSIKENLKTRLSLIQDRKLSSFERIVLRNAKSL